MRARAPYFFRSAKVASTKPASELWSDSALPEVMSSAI